MKDCKKCTNTFIKGLVFKTYSPEKAKKIWTKKKEKDLCVKNIHVQTYKQLPVRNCQLNQQLDT